MFRPMTYAPRGRMSQSAAVASASLARSSPRCQRWTSRPPRPSGCSRLWSGPATKPSSEIDMWQVVSGIGVLLRIRVPRMDTSDLQGRTAVVTGAGSGIGRETALLCAQRGADLAICDVDDDGLA